MQTDYDCTAAALDILCARFTGFGSDGGPVWRVADRALDAIDEAQAGGLDAILSGDEIAPGAAEAIERVVHAMPLGGFWRDVVAWREAAE
ncbi:MAG TPA: hypothetical protein VGG39_23535 [Polyangiaceae bacterium]|jgi:hypothetical protein